MWNLKDPVSMILGLFAVVVGAALERFLTESPVTSERHFAKRWHRELLYWSALIIILSQVVRFFFGATAHLNETYVLTPDALKTWDIYLLLKDMFFLIVFGIFLVKTALSKSSVEFTLWLIAFSVADIFWCITEYVTRYSFWSKWWLYIGLIQLAIALVSWWLLRAKSDRDLYVLFFLAIVYLVLCGLDLWQIIDKIPRVQPAQSHATLCVVARDYQT